MSISKDDYEDMIRKKPSLRPTEETKLMGFSYKPTEALKAHSMYSALVGGLKEPLAESAPYPSLEHQNASLVPKTHQIRPSQDEAKLNKTERAWLGELRIRRPKFLGIQSMTFKLGDDCRYTPDFVEISNEDKFIAWEVKGFMRDDALVKLKVAARMFAFIEFYVVKRIKGAWETKKINP